MMDFCGYYTSHAFEPWKEPLHIWFSLLDKYASIYKNEDAAYWYNERATLSSFVGALWRSDAVALEEYRCSRRFGGQPVPGRTDLWFQLGPSEYVVEAKQCWPCRASRLPEYAKGPFDSATSQLHAEVDGGASRVALLFVVPSLAGQPDASFADEWIQVASKISADVRAWYFPTTMRTLKSRRTLRFYPGILLLARST
ncbi:hypothetical protein WME79_44565 [Sorangium sp. So ce726]|uniref:hypothetical protein n=1 Tax=Sorangium sp. So ce726 TaxID=3133319 RepID=UPI003F61CC31